VTGRSSRPKVSLTTSSVRQAETPVQRTAVSGLACLLVTAALTAAVAQGATEWFDRPVFRALHATRGASMATLAARITSLGDTAVLLSVLLCMGALLPTARRARWRAVILPILATAIARLVCEALKVGLARPRPPTVGWLAPASGFAFPSGHATSSTAGFVTLLLLVVGVAGTRRRRAWCAACVVPPLLIGLSRVQLGVHWPSDVIAGWALGAAVACGVICLDQVALRRREPQLNR